MDRHANGGPRALLKFGQGTAKIPGVTTFALPSGWTCPFSSDCLAWADRRTGRVRDAPQTSFRCYKASEEARHPASRAAGWWNYDLLRKCKTAEAMAGLILDSLLPGTPVVRVHVGGDFWSRAYFRAWLLVARRRPRTTFYFFTKSLRYWLAHLGEVGDGHSPGGIPNVVPTASWGGRDDELIRAHGLRSARVVFSGAEARALRLEIDVDDSHAMRHGEDFALALHGTQPAGSEAGHAVQRLRAEGHFGHRVPLTLGSGRGL
jgi:hypothetical protein